MNNKYVLLTVVVVIIGMNMLLPAHFSFAHVLQADGSIGAVLHIDPNDDPIAQQPAYFFLDIANKNGVFSLTDCTCTALITNTAGDTIAKPTILPENGQTAEGTFEYVFQNSAAYVLTVKGTPKNAGVFQNFTLRYTFQVEQAHDSSVVKNTGFQGFIHSEHGLHYILFGAGFIVIFFLFLNEYRKNKK